MKDISVAASLSCIYTNHCVRGTTASDMKRSGYTLQDMAFVTKHKNLESLKFYLEQPTLEDKENVSKDLFKYTSNSDHDDNDDDNFEVPPTSQAAWKKV